MKSLNVTFINLETNIFPKMLGISVERMVFIIKTINEVAEKYHKKSERIKEIIEILQPQNNNELFLIGNIYGSIEMTNQILRAGGNEAEQILQKIS